MPDFSHSRRLGKRHWYTNRGHRLAAMKPSGPGPKIIHGRRLPGRHTAAGRDGTGIFSSLTAAWGRDSVHGISDLEGAIDSSPLRDLSRARFRTRTYFTHCFRPENWAVSSGFVPLAPSRLGNFLRQSQAGREGASPRTLSYKRQRRRRLSSGIVSLDRVEVVWLWVIWGKNHIIL
jgi:hypothetical protein